jgi:hypothetical protein
MLERSNPPIGSTPITPFLEEHAFRSEYLATVLHRLWLETQLHGESGNEDAADVT